MYLLRIVPILIGLMFISLGYAIGFKGKYNLINNFKNDKKNRILNNSFAKRVGIIEFIGGIFYFVIGIVNMFLNDIFALISFILCTVGIIVALIINQIKSLK